MVSSMKAGLIFFLFLFTAVSPVPEQCLVVDAGTIFPEEALIRYG